jgi:rhombotail lipoprotein
MIAAAVAGLSGCAAFDQARCAPHCASQTHNASSLVSFLYQDGAAPPPQDTIPELHLPLRVGLAFLPSQTGGAATLDAAHRQELLERIRQHFLGKEFVSEITIVPDYYLTSSRGFEGLQGIQRLYSVDLMALVSYDQVTYLDDNKLSLGYLTILGAYVLKGSRHDITTLVDLAVVDPSTRSLVLRAGGTDTRHGDSTLIDQERDTRTADLESFSTATDQMIGHFDGALGQFEADVRAGKAKLRVVRRQTAGTDTGATGGAGAMEGFWTLMLSLLLFVRLIGVSRGHHADVRRIVRGHRPDSRIV